MLEAFRRHLSSSGLIPAGLRVLVGYSGGADSTCLLHLLHECGVDVVAGHLHHGQREEADEELRRCQEFCDSLGIPFASGRVDVPHLAELKGLSLEEAGRQARYGFFSQVAHRVDCHLTATAHTKDDLVETVLFNLTRGSGLAGVSGIPASREGIVRPLLPFSRSETLAYCQERGFWIHHDPANSDLSFSRARIRHRVLPELEAINPGVRDAISRFASLADEEDRFLNGMAAAGLEKAEIPLNGHLRFLTLDSEVAFSRQELAALPDVLLARGLRLAAAVLGAALDSAQTEVIVLGIREGDRGSVTCEGGAVACVWDQEEVTFSQVAVDSPFRFTLTVPGETISDEFGWMFLSWPSSDEEPKKDPASLEAVIDRSQVQGSLYFRTVQDGDVIQPVGMDGRKKVRDIMGEMGLTRAAKSRLPIVCDLLGPIWIPGGPVSARVMVKPGSDQRLVIRFGPVGG